MASAGEMPACQLAGQLMRHIGMQLAGGYRLKAVAAGGGAVAATFHEKPKAPGQLWHGGVMRRLSAGGVAESRMAAQCRRLAVGMLFGGGGSHQSAVAAAAWRIAAASKGAQKRQKRWRRGGMRR